MWTSIKNVDRLIRYTFDTCNANYFLKDVTWEYSNRLKVALGKCTSYKQGDKYSCNIKLSSKFAEKLPQQEFEDLVVHEACHAVDFLLNKSSSGHGLRWQKYMRMCGLSPEVKYDGPVSVADYKITCKCCSETYNITKTLYSRRMNKRGRLGVCACKTVLSPDNFSLKVNK
jgi:predicted SprT family Zn-dependent metalloprotease